MAFYQRIRDLREDADKTQTEIAAYLGTTAQYYGKYEKENFPFPVPYSWQTSTMSVWTISPDAPISRKIPMGSPLQTMPCWCCKNTPPSPNATRAGWNSFLIPSPNNRLSKKKHDRPCEIAKSVPSQTIRFFSFRISTA